MKILTLTAVALSFVAARTPATSIDSAARPSVSSFHHDGVLGTSADFRFVTTSSSAANRAHVVALAEIERLRLVLSSWDDKSELAKLFAQGSLDHPSAELVAVLNAYSDWNTRTGHAYSARVGALTSLWQQATVKGVVPDSSALTNVAREIAKPAWRIESGRVIALTSQRPDLSSLGKGFIIDRTLRVVRDSVPEIEGVLVNIGGDIQVWGTPTDGSAWHVNVANPQSFADNATPLTRLALRGGAVSSSGDYQRGFKVGTVHYSHIFDPRTGYPVDHVVGVTVIARDNATANALATTLSVMSPDSGMALVRRVSGAEALLVTANGETIRSSGFAAYQESDVSSIAGTVSNAAISAKLAIDVTPTEPNRHAPFVAVWVTDTAGHHVRTVAFWGDKPKYLHEMSRWWGLNHADTQLIDAVTRATRPAGKYSLDWDGLDQKGAAVAPGAYTFWLEVGYEDGAHSAKSVTLTCGGSAATGAIPQAAAFTGAEISCGPAKN